MRPILAAFAALQLLTGARLSPCARPHALQRERRRPRRDLGSHGQPPSQRSFAIPTHSIPDGLGAYYVGSPVGYDTRPNGSTLALGNDDGTVSLIDARSLRPRAMIRALAGRVASVGYLPDGRLLVSDELGSAVFVDPDTGAVGRPLQGFGSAFTPSLSRDGRLMASIGTRAAFVLLRTLTACRPSGRPRAYYPAADDVTSVALSPDGRTMALATNLDSGGGVEIVDVATLRRRTRLPDSNGVMTARRSPRAPTRARSSSSTCVPNSRSARR
jgi:WD40 repeat protein